jgi:hypothetical protein
LTEVLTDNNTKLPERVREPARKNYELWKDNPYHTSLEFKPVKATRGIYSFRVGLYGRALGAMKVQEQTAV